MSDVKAKFPSHAFSLRTQHKGYITSDVCSTSIISSYAFLNVSPPTPVHTHMFVTSSTNKLISPSFATRSCNKLRPHLLTLQVPMCKFITERRYDGPSLAQVSLLIIISLQHTHRITQRQNNTYLLSPLRGCQKTRRVHDTASELKCRIAIEDKLGVEITSKDTTTLQILTPLKTKRRLLYLKTQSVPRCKNFSSRL